MQPALLILSVFICSSLGDKIIPGMKTDESRGSTIRSNYRANQYPDPNYNYNFNYQEPSGVRINQEYQTVYLEDLVAPEYSLPEYHKDVRPDVTVKYYLKGRQGLGFDKRTAYALGMRYPLTPELLETVRRYPEEKEQQQKVL